MPSLARKTPESFPSSPIAAAPNPVAPLLPVLATTVLRIGSGVGWAISVFGGLAGIAGWASSTAGHPLWAAMTQWAPILVALSIIVGMPCGGLYMCLWFRDELRKYQHAPLGMDAEGRPVTLRDLETHLTKMARVELDKAGKELAANVIIGVDQRLQDIYKEKTIHISDIATRLDALERYVHGEREP